MKRLVTNRQLIRLHTDLQVKYPNQVITATDIQNELAKIPVKMHVSTIRGRFIAMKRPLSRAQVQPTPTSPTPTSPTPRVTVTTMSSSPPPSQCTEQKPAMTEVKIEPRTKRGIPKLPEYKDKICDELKPHIPNGEFFQAYVERGVDKRLALNYDLQAQVVNGQLTLTYPLTQGKQGTGKTFGHIYYAHTRGLPCITIGCNKDFQLSKYFGDKTIENGTIVFKEGLMVKAFQSPSVIVFDEVNRIAESNMDGFLNFLQDRALFIKDANKTYKLHPMCKIGFAQNPRSAKYIGGNVRASNFLGRCTYITYPEFTKAQLAEALKKRYPHMEEHDRNLFITFYKEVLKVIDRNDMPFDISIRQLNNVIDLWLHGAPLKEALEDGLLSITEAASQPESKEALYQIAKATWKELSNILWATRRCI